jgi:hypothetical protein
MSQNDILHTMKKEGKCQTPNKNTGKKSNSGSSRKQSAKRFPTQKIYCITYLAFRINV